MRCSQTPALAWRAGAVVLVSLLLAACATGPSPYRAANGDSFGYSEQKIESNRYRVTYTGDSLTDRQTVENYLIYRAAELTLETGHDYFIVQSQGTERRDRVAGGFISPRYPGFYYSIGPSYYWHRNRLFHYDTYRVVERYEASAVIKVYEGEVPEDDASAYDARDVIETLGPQIIKEGDGQTSRP